MFTDIRGYSALVQKDEALARTLLRRHRKLVRSAYRGFGAHEVKTMGDGFLIVFPSSLKAVNCALRIQRGHRDHNAEAPVDRRIVARIGIHAGVVEHRGRDIFGDDVNIAARVEPIARPGGVCITDRVASEVQGTLDFPLQSIGYHRLKNILHPVELFSIQLPWLDSHADRERHDPSRVAVLPFVNVSPDAESDYFTDGLTEELIYRLSLVRGIAVIAHSSARRYKGSQKRPAHIAAELRVGTILQGTVRESSGRMRVTTQLIDATSEEQRWADRYEFDMTETFAIQSQIAERVATELQLVLSSEEAHAIAQSPTHSMEAYSLYLQGRHFLNRRDPGSIETALEKFQHATQLDSSFAAAYAATAEAYALMPQLGRLDLSSAADKAEEAGRRAIACEPRLAAGYAALGVVAYIARRRYDEAEELLRKALDLNPDDAANEYYYGVLLRNRLRLRDAAASLQRAVAMDPLSPIYCLNTAFVLMMQGEFRKAEHFLARGLELVENEYMLTHFALLYLLQGEFDRSLEWCDRSLAHSRQFTMTYLVKARALLASGVTDAVFDVIDELDQSVSETDTVLPGLGSSRLQALMLRAIAEARYSHNERAYVLLEQIRSASGRAGKMTALAAVFTALSDQPQAVSALEAAFEQEEPALSTLKTDQLFEPVRDDPNVQDLLRRMQLDPEPVYSQT